MSSSTASLLTNDDLPEWDLKNLYTSLKDPQIESDIKTAEQKSDDFLKKYQGLFITSSWNSNQLLKAIEEYEEIQEPLGRLISFAGLSYYKNLKNLEISQFYQRIQEKNTFVGGKLVFFTLEINQIAEDILTKALEESQELQRYRPWLKKVRLFRPHQLSEDLEKLFLEKSLTASQAWNRLYDETLAHLKFQVDNQDLTLPQVTDLMSGSDPKKRQQAAKALEKGLNHHLSLFTFITNTLAKDKEIEDTWRKYPEPASERHLVNQVDPQAIESLTKAVKSSYSRLSHRYYALKAKLLGLENLEYWDRNAPLPQQGEQNISWLQARTIVLDAYERFSPEMTKIGRQFFDNHWIDVPVREGKTSGAFAHPTIPSANPYLLLNFQGKNRDVMTLAHELGHGIHQVLAGEQGILLSDTPLTLAETASVFGEMLTFQSLLKHESDPLRQRQLLAGKIDDMLNTVVRQIAFYDFEQQLHQKRRQGELSADDIGDIWLQTQKEALGPAVKIDDTIRPYWSYISHFIHSPFYVYAYAFGDCLVNSLYAVYQKEPEGFTDKYIELLKAGGTKHYTDLLKAFGLNADDPEFWNQGLTMIADFINQLEVL
jgi:oligoendopeptidase F